MMFCCVTFQYCVRLLYLPFTESLELWKPECLLGFLTTSPNMQNSLSVYSCSFLHFDVARLLQPKILIYYGFLVHHSHFFIVMKN